MNWQVVYCEVGEEKMKGQVVKNTYWIRGALRERKRLGDLFKDAFFKEFPGPCVYAKGGAAQVRCKGKRYYDEECYTKCEYYRIFVEKKVSRATFVVFTEDNYCLTVSGKACEELPEMIFICALERFMDVKKVWKVNLIYGENKEYVSTPENKKIFELRDALASKEEEIEGMAGIFEKMVEGNSQLKEEISGLAQQIKSTLSLVLAAQRSQLESQQLEEQIK